MSVKIIGCGSQLAGDDAVGLLAIRELKLRLASVGGVEAFEAGTPGLSLLDLMEGAGAVFILDAISSGSPPGTLHELSAGDLPNHELFPLSLHQLSIADALALGRLICPEKLPAEILIFGVEIERATVGEPLTPAVRAAVPLLVRRVLHALHERGLPLACD